MMAEHLNSKASGKDTMARVSKWEVLDRAMRIIVYLAIIYVLFKLFQIPFP